MSTYFYFRCRKCDETGGFFSRQMWGCGNFDIVSSFKFICYHTIDCGGNGDIHVVSEHDDNAYKEKDKKEFLKLTEGYFPCSNDWDFVKDNWTGTRAEADKKWIDNEIH